MSEQVQQPYGNAGHHGPGLVALPERQVRFRFGYVVDGDLRGEQFVGWTESLADANRLARNAAEEQRRQLRELGMKNTVTAWVQSRVRTTTEVFGEPQFQEQLR